MSTPVNRATDVWRVVAAREVTTQLRSRSFLVSVGALALGLIALVVVLTLTADQERTYDVAVIDDAGTAAVERGSEVADLLGEGTGLDPRSYDNAADAERAVRDGDADAALLPADDGYELVGDAEVDGILGDALRTSVAELATERNAAEQDVDLAALTVGTVVSERLLDPDAEDAALRQIASFVFVLLFYVTALTFGMQIAATVTQEKESRVVEILAAAVPVRALLWGKIIGTSALAISLTVLLAAIGVVSLLVTGNGDALEVVGPAIGWYVVFFVLGFVALAGVWTMAGSLAPRQQDLSATTAPLQLVLFAPYLLAVTAGESVRTVVSMLPIVSTMLMPARLAEGDVPAWQLMVAVLTTVLAAVLLVVVSARVYERALLQTGHRMGFREALSGLRGS